MNEQNRFHTLLHRRRMHDDNHMSIYKRFTKLERENMCPFWSRFLILALTYGPIHGSRMGDDKRYSKVELGRIMVEMVGTK